MYDRETILHLVQDAERDTPHCACGALMTPADRDGALWLECITSRQPGNGRTRRPLTLDWLLPHTRRLIVDAEEFLAA
jgi:hypothetical protein